ncbi:fatty acid synthase [Aplysia californica]|uniref:Fatty acid synthase n=1 Tax=Aplysia californica TaxID=6500 RepID=A0ABM1VSE4_APLCA|nr:fatty acid synthase [Aplysia californica]
MPAYADVNSNHQHSTPLINGLNGTGSDLPDCVKYAKYQGDICITGMSGRSGQARTLDELKKLLWEKKDGFTTKALRFDIDKYGTQKRHAYIDDAEYFDSDYFGIAPKNAEFLDPNIRLSMEAAYEATVDAGYSMQEIRGSNTGVYVSCVAYDANCYWLSKGLEVIGEAKKGIGVVNNFRASRISYAMDLRGPSVCVDTACSGYLAAIEAAMKDMRLGIIDSAIVAGCQLHCNPMSSLLFMELGAAGPDAKCYTFDERGQQQKKRTTSL